MRFEYWNTPLRDVVLEICNAYALTLDDQSMELDGTVTASFETESAEIAVTTIFSGSPFSGWIMLGLMPGQTLLVIHDQRGLDQLISYGHDDGETLYSLFRSIPELYPLGVHIGPKQLRIVEPFVMNDVPLREVLDVACAKAGLRWKLERGVVLIAERDLSLGKWPIPNCDGIF